LNNASNGSNVRDVIFAHDYFCLLNSFGFLWKKKKSDVSQKHSARTISRYIFNLFRFMLPQAKSFIQINKAASLSDQH